MSRRRGDSFSVLPTLTYACGHARSEVVRAGQRPPRNMTLQSVKCPSCREAEAAAQDRIERVKKEVEGDASES